MDMKEKLQELETAARKRIEESDGLDKLNDVRVAYLGKKGELTAIMKGMKDVAPQERPKFGQLVNETRAKIEGLLEECKKELENKAREAQMKAEVIDVTLPAKKSLIGHRHPNTIALEEVERIFIGMGYEGCGRSGGGVCRLQLHETEYSGRSSGERRAGHILHYRLHSAAFPDLSGAGAYHGKGQASHPYDRSGTCVPF